MKISELPLAPSVSTTDDVPIDRSGVTYRVHYEALRGNGIASVAKTGTSGLVDTYTMTFTDGSTFSYTVTNGASGSGSWGTITGTLSNQTDLQNALDAKAPASTTYTKAQVDSLITAATCLIVDCGTISSLPATISNASITSDMVVVRAEFGNPDAQSDDWTVTTSSGSVTISGTLSGSTTLKLYLVKSR